MSFEVFRRHQKKMLAVFAILAMFGFVVSDSLPRLLNSNASGRDQPIVELYGKTLHQSELNEMLTERSLANRFLFRIFPYFGPEPFGSLKTRDLVDAVILRHEADRLGIPAGHEVGKDFLMRVTQGRMNADTFQLLMMDFHNQVSDEQVLSAIADQVRLNYVRGTLNSPSRLLGAPMVTPYDIYRAYRDQNEKVSAKLVEVPVDKFLAKVPEPSGAEIQAFYDKYKDTLPDPTRSTPGFKVPRQVRVEILSVDGNALARSLKDGLTDAELRAAYENRKSEFEVKGDPTDLPADLFAGHPELTPPIIQPFNEVRSILGNSLAEEKAQSEIVERFGKLKRDVLDKYFDDYQEALSIQEEAKRQADSGTASLPEPPDLKELARREKVEYELTPMLSREDAEKFGSLSGAQVGLSRQRDRSGRSFTDEFFDPKTGLFESVELTDLLGTRYLAWKTKDVAPRVPPLDEVRMQVALAWRMDKARPLARKAADDLAEQLKKQPATIKDGTFQGYRVVTTPGIPRKQSPTSLSPDPLAVSEPEESTISEVAFPGPAFREAFFSLQPGSTAVAANEPETVYYAMSLERRDPATFTALYAPNGEEFRFKSLAREQADRQLINDWMAWLRQEAGLPPDWVPPDEAKEKDAKARNRG
jgi:hypothetical protein